MTPKSPEVSIVIATRDRSEMTNSAIGTALDQTFREIEVIVVDDGSKQPFEAETKDERVSVVRLSESRGVSAARNTGLARAGGKWVTFLDDDDELLPAMIETSLDAARDSKLPPPVAVVSGIEIVGADGSTETIRLPVSLPKGKDYFLEGAPKGKGFTVGNTLLVPRDLLVRLGGFDEHLRSAVHSELFLRINAVCSIEGVPEVLYRIKRHHGEHVHSNVLARAEAMERTVSKHQEAFARHPRRYARYVSSTGIAYLRAGKWGPAVRTTSKALRIDPRSWKVLRSWMVSLIGPAFLGPYRWLIRHWVRVRRRWA